MVLGAGSLRHIVANARQAIQDPEDYARGIAVNVENQIVFCQFCNFVCRLSNLQKHLRSAPHKQRMLAESNIESMDYESLEVTILSITALLSLRFAFIVFIPLAIRYQLPCENKKSKHQTPHFHNH